MTEEVLPRSQETAVLCLSDPHYGKRTPTFDPDRCRARLQLAGERTAKIRAIYSTGIDFDRLVVLILGDVNDGCEIFAGQAHEQAITNVEEQARECAAMLTEWLLKQREVWGEVAVYCCAGNHGRSGGLSKSFHERANWDLVTYQYLRLALQPHGLPIDIDHSRPFLRVVGVRGHGILMHHGHFVQAGVLPGPALMRRLVNWSIVQSIPPWELAVMGHYHTIGYLRQSGVQLMMSGTLVTDDPYPIERLGVESPPGWWLFGVSDKHVPTWQIALDLDDRKAAPPEQRTAPTAKHVPGTAELGSHSSAPQCGLVARPSPSSNGTSASASPAKSDQPAFTSAPSASHSIAHSTAQSGLPPEPDHGTSSRTSASAAASSSASDPASGPPCVSCSRPLEPGDLYARCRACRTFKCGGCGRDVVMKKFRHNARYCDLRCMGIARAR